MPDDRPDISLIVIFHNAEATIQRTLQSLAAQTLTSVEYLFIDDGSNDLSVNVLQSFVAINPDFAGRHRLIRSEMRRGSAHATRLGIENAKGSFIMRCDADDYLEPTALADMLAVATDQQSDIVIAPYIEEAPGRKRIVSFHRHRRPASLNDFAIDTLHFSLCNKLLRRSLLSADNILPFDGIDCWEDLGVVSRAMTRQPKIGFVEKPLYHYVRHPQAPSLSRSNRGRILDDHLRMALLIEQWMTDRNLTEQFTPFLNHLKFCAKVKMMRGRDKDVDRWKKTFPEVNSRILSLRHIPLIYRLLFKTVAIMPTAITQWIADRIAPFYRSYTSTNS